MGLGIGDAGLAEVAVKTTANPFDALERHIKERHSYETPEIVRVAIDCGSAEYLKCIEESVRQ
jgi:periplasmic divalent cation tolerance protein